MKYIHLIPATSGAVATTFSLFYMMQSLVAGGDVVLDSKPPREILVYFQEPEQTQKPRIKDRIPKPKTVVKPPSTPKLPPKPKGKSPTYVGPRPERPTGPAGPEISLTQMDGERIPLVRIAPAYPRRCQERGISGWVIMDFDVNIYGAVENPVIVEADPSGCFNRTALKTITRFKYKPTTIDGQPRRSSGVRFRMGFEIDEG